MDGDIPAINTSLLALQKFSHLLEEDVSYFDKFYQYGQMLAFVQMVVFYNEDKKTWSETIDSASVLLVTVEERHQKFSFVLKSAFL